MTSLVAACPYVFDLHTIKDEVLDIVNAYPDLGPSMSLTHSKDTMHLSTKEKLLEAFNDSEQLDDRKYTLFNDEFKGTQLHRMFTTVPNIGRFRIMMVYPLRSYNMHVDVSEKYHFAIDTNPGCYFLFPDQNEIIQIPDDGILYQVDTTKRHSFVNCGDTRRIHLVLADLNTYKIT